MTLGRLPVLFRFFALFLLLSIPLAGLGALFFGLKGAAVGLGLVYLLLTAAAMASESATIREAHATAEPSPGLKNSFDGVIKELQRRQEGGDVYSEPQLLVFADPLPNALCGKGLLGPGAILVSTGMLAHFDEQEIREVIKVCFLRLQQSEWIFVSLCNTLLNWLLLLAPKAWVELFFSTKPSVKPIKKGSALSFAWFLVLLPWVRFILKVGQPGSQGVDTQESWISAMRKIADSAKRSGREATPSLSLLWVRTWGGAAREQKFFLPLT